MDTQGYVVGNADHDVNANYVIITTLEHTNPNLRSFDYQDGPVTQPA